MATDPGTPPVKDMQVVEANLGAVHGERAEQVLLPAIEAQAPDVLIVEELNPELVPYLQARLRLPRRYRSRARRDETGEEPGTRLNRAFLGVFSRYPIALQTDPTGLAEGMPGLRLRVDAPGGQVMLYALHLPKPSPLPSSFSATYAGRDGVIDAVITAVEAETLPALVVGDLNLSDRETGYRRLTAVLDDAVRTGSWAGPTSAKDSLRWLSLLLRIDHVLREPSWCSADGRRFDLPGSDHRGVAVRVGPCPSSVPGDTGSCPPLAPAAAIPAFGVGTLGW